MDFWQPFKLSLTLASITTCLTIMIGVPFAWLLSKLNHRIQVPIEASLALPTVLPPTVLGFYLLLLFSNTGPIGSITQWIFGAPLAFHFSGLIIGSVIYSFPFVVQPILARFKEIGTTPFKVAASLGEGPMTQFFATALPLAKTSIISGAVLGFAHTLGEFGVVLMIGGNIPSETRVLSIAIYNHVEAMEYKEAHLLSGILLMTSFCILLIMTILNRPRSSERYL